MKHIFKKLCMVVFINLLLFGCSSYNEGKASLSNENTAEIAMDLTTSEESAPNETEITNNPNQDRMVIYQANIRMEVEDYERTFKQIQIDAEAIGGYIVQSNVYNEHKEQLEGAVVLRIPQNNFYSFLDKLEQLSVKVYSKNISGEDVTEEYVDLQSRLKSKRIVEDRLLQFLKDAKETKDVLAISQDLERVQEEIEHLVGRIKYLDNQTSLSTVTVSMIENKVVIANIDNDGLNTWDKVKKEFVESINGLISFASTMLVLIIGYSPIWLLIITILMGVFYIGKIFKNRKLQKDKQK
ncbi:DUF4349 domain-containing protein [Bacillus sp. SM2101]|uniref:DUF4349 domain-containing protein n=1 Tax=Bacillus sp. SM2101 TaxID=2805366 RepID=UPI001BDF2B18|nr:DUF4349 domain-containing protein [Bacillus sp. SM2101]